VLQDDGGRLVTHCGPVRPFGCVGEGFQRIWDAGVASVGGFYHIGIPSFQGEWGFWLMVSGRDWSRPFDFVRTSPTTLGIVTSVTESVRWFDYTWLSRCASPDRLWGQAVHEAVVAGGAVWQPQAAVANM
jgi:hypothetical protein